ncbi:MAG: undecaprenyl-diphosphate phosphatase [Pseudomonadales bacterium]|nr:undecaprenyl-diphosphate phosphatase [Pseudomonadales bacterium]
MDLFQAIFLAIVQGLTEFLPISSSGHLIVPAVLFGWADQGLAFDVAVHVGTLLAVLVYFRKDVIAILNGWFVQIFKRIPSPEAQLGWAVIIGTIPAVIAGLLVSDLVGSHLRSIEVIAATSIVFGLLLLYSDIKGGKNRTIESIGWKVALMIGLAQAVALIPGTSRSGITITCALLLGYTRESAARFSFLLSMPTIFGAGLLMSLELIETGETGVWQDLLIGAGFAAISAYICIHWFLKLLDKIGFMPFVAYRMLFGGLLFWMAYSYV